MTTGISVSSELDQFIASARTFLDSNAARRAEPPGARAWGAGSEAVALFREPTPGEERAEVEQLQRWRRTVFDAGFGWITGPAEYGGAGLSAVHDRAYQRLEREYDAPDKGLFLVGLSMVAPTILAHGTPELKAAYLGALHRGDIVGCQLFSEPGAGSDLASVGVSAIADGDSWIISGQKVWTSGAHYSDLGLLLARTRPGPRHQNLTMFLLDMHSPGVEVRPLRQMTGGAAFNEVFIDGARIHDDYRLGPVDGGWTVALTTLSHERGSVGGTNTGGSGPPLVDRLLALARHLGVDGDHLIRQELASVYIDLAVARLTRIRNTGRSGPSPSALTGKLAYTKNLEAVSRLLTHLLGQRLIADTGEWSTYAWSAFVLGVAGMRLAGGTDEIQRTIVAERALGLPREPTFPGSGE